MRVPACMRVEQAAEDSKNLSQCVFGWSDVKILSHRLKRCAYTCRKADEAAAALLQLEEAATASTTEAAGTGRVLLRSIICSPCFSCLVRNLMGDETSVTQRL